MYVVFLLRLIFITIFLSISVEHYDKDKSEEEAFKFNDG